MDTRSAETSTSSSSLEQRGKDRDLEHDLEWRAHPAAQRPAQAVLALGIILVVAAFVYMVWESPGLAALGVVVLMAALNRFFLPSRFTVDGDGITASYPLKRLRYRWSELRRFVWDEHGGYLSTRAARSRLDAYRGMHLLFDADRDRIIDHIRHRMGEVQDHDGGPKS